MPANAPALEKVAGCDPTQTRCECHPTHHLYVEWSRKVKSKLDLQLVFGPIGEFTVQPIKKHSVFLTFANVQQASRAKETLNGTAWDCIRGKLFLSANSSFHPETFNTLLGRHVYITHAAEVAKAVPPAVFTSSEAANVPGLLLIKDFVSEDEEAALIAAIETTEWHTTLRNRRVQHFG
jgi:hypothetical protein